MPEPDSMMILSSIGSLNSALQLSPNPIFSSAVGDGGSGGFPRASIKKATNETDPTILHINKPLRSPITGGRIYPIAIPIKFIRLAKAVDRPRSLGANHSADKAAGAAITSALELARMYCPSKVTA